MAESVEVSVRSALSKVIDELAEIREKAKDTGEAFRQTGNAVGEGMRDNVKRTETFLGQVRNLGRRVADQLRGDFKSLISVNALTDAMRISNQFRKNIDETVELNDTIRKLGATFGIANREFAGFQARMTRGLGEIGLGSEVAVSALKGLAETPVRGQANLLGYSQQAGMLASVGGERGKEGDIAQGLARVIQARGGDVNSADQVKALAESLRRVFVQTGQAPSQSLKAMEQIFKQMPEDLRRSLTSTALQNLTAASAVGGPNSTKFLEEYLGKSPIARLAFEAQGGKGIVGEQGIDVEKFQAFAKSILGRVGGDPRLAAQTLGLSEEAAEGFVRLSENLDKVKAAQNAVGRTTGDLNSQYRSSMGLGEAFAANINRVKKALATPLAAATQGASNLLSGTAQSDGGATAVALGAGAAATLLAGGALRGLGRGLGGIGGTIARKEGAEELLGQKTVPVYVVNAGEIGGGLVGDLLSGGAGAAAAGGGAMGLLGPIAALIGLGGAGMALKQGVDDTIAGAGKDTTSVSYSPEQIGILKRMYSAGKIPEGRRAEVEKILQNQDMGAWAPGGAGGGGSAAPEGGARTGTMGQPFPGRNADRGNAFPARDVRVIVESKDPRLKVTTDQVGGGRGATN